MAKNLTPPSPTCEAIAIQSDEVYERYMKYPTGCAKAFRIGYFDVNQLILEKW